MPLKINVVDAGRSAFLKKLDVMRHNPRNENCGGLVSWG